MAIPTVTAPLPAESSDPWITARNLLDTQLKATANAAAAGVDAVEAARGANSGIATLDAGGKLTPAQLPALAVTEYLGSVATQAAMLALAGQQGDWAIRTDRGTVFIITGSNPAVIGSWTEMAYPTAPVLSVNGKTGVVSLVPGDLGAATAGDLDNTFTVATDAQTDATQALADAAAANTNANGRVPTSRQVAGHALTADIARAGLNTLGLGEAVFIPNGGTVPVGTPAYTIVIEAGA